MQIAQADQFASNASLGLLWTQQFLHHIVTVRTIPTKTQVIAFFVRQQSLVAPLALWPGFSIVILAKVVGYLIQHSTFVINAVIT